MNEYYSMTVNTELNCDGIYSRVSAAVPELQWRRGESEGDGALIVSGRNPLGASVKFWLYDDEIGQASVRISLRGAGADESGSSDWQQELLSKLVDEVIPQLEGAVPGPGETGPRIQPPGRPSPVRSTTPPTRVSRRGARLPSGDEIVVDLFDWLPPHGEDAVSYRSAGRELHIDVAYGIGDETHMVTLIFERDRYVLRQPFPGADLLPGSYSMSEVGSGEVVAFENSEVAEAHAAGNYGRRTPAGRGLRHYAVHFADMGVMFHVVAEGVRVERP